jgi:hypothetical protein
MDNRPQALRCPGGNRLPSAGGGDPANSRLGSPRSEDARNADLEAFACGGPHTSCSDTACLVVEAYANGRSHDRLDEEFDTEPFLGRLDAHRRTIGPRTRLLGEDAAG